MHLSFSSPWVDPRDIPGEPRGNGTVLVFLFSPAGERNCLVLETTSLEHGNIPTGFVRVLVSVISLSTKVYLRPSISFRFVIQCDR